MAKKTLSFEEKLTEFQDIINDLDSGELQMDTLLERYEKGMTLATELKEYLNTAEQKIIDITKKYSEKSED